MVPEISKGLSVASPRQSTIGRALNILGGIALTEDYQTPNAVILYLGVRLWVIRFIVERATAQIVS